MNGHELNHILKCHPFSRSDIIKAKDTILYSAQGEKIIDFEAGIWCTAVGHNNPIINTVIKEQIDQVMHLHYKLTNGQAELLAQHILAIAKIDDGKAVFLSSGSEAVALGMRLAQRVTRKNKVLTFSKSYLSAYKNFNMPRNQEHWEEIDFTRCRNCLQPCSQKCPMLKDIPYSEIAAFILEPGNTSGQVLLPPAQLVNYLVHQVRAAGGLVMVNEVTTGIGRTGEWFGYNHYDIQPDIISIGKSLGNGYPISAVLMRAQVAQMIEAQHFHYAQSHQNDPLGCAIGDAVLTLIEQEKLIERAQIVGKLFLKELQQLQATTSVIKEVRGRGLMLAIELNQKNITEKIFEKMLQHGFFIGTTSATNVLRFYPSLTISEAHIKAMCHTLKQVLLAL